MNCDEIDHDIAREIGECRYCPECGEFLAGETPAGEHPRLVGEHAERAGNMEPTTSQGHSLRVGETKGGVELRRITEEMRDEASAARDIVENYSSMRSYEEMVAYETRADALEDYATKIEAALLSEIPDESEAEGVVECPSCGQEWYEGVEDDHCLKGSACPWARGKRRERSGSGND